MVKGDEETLKLYDKLKTHNNKIFQTGHQYHSSRLYAHLVEMIQSGEIGVVSAVPPNGIEMEIGEGQCQILNLNDRLIGECTANILMD